MHTEWSIQAAAQEVAWCKRYAIKVRLIQWSLKCLKLVWAGFFFPRYGVRSGIVQTPFQLMMLSTIQIVAASACLNVHLHLDSILDTNALVDPGHHRGSASS